MVVPYCRCRCIVVLFTFSKTLWCNFKVLLLERIPWLVVTCIWQQKHALLFMAAWFLFLWERKEGRFPDLFSFFKFRANLLTQSKSKKQPTLLNNIRNLKKVFFVFLIKRWKLRIQAPIQYEIKKAVFSVTTVSKTISMIFGCMNFGSGYFILCVQYNLFRVVLVNFSPLTTDCKFCSQISCLLWFCPSAGDIRSWKYFEVSIWNNVPLNE